MSYIYPLLILQQRTCNALFPIVIQYCNNNFDDDQIDFASKMAFPSPKKPQGQFQAQEKPIILALNIPTYMNLYGYGYRNIYELAELVNDPVLSLKKTIVK